MLILAVLTVSSTLLTLGLHRHTVQAEQSWRVQWSRLQSQALAQGGMMWAQARLEDPRPVDDQCQATAVTSNTGPGSATFAERWARPGGRVRCEVSTEGVSRDRATWNCTCFDSAAPPVLASATGGSMVMDVAFHAAGQGLLMSIQATSSAAADASNANWGESVLLRRTATGQWRPVVGTWEDGR